MDQTLTKNFHQSCDNNTKLNNIVNKLISTNLPQETAAKYSYNSEDLLDSSEESEHCTQFKQLVDQQKIFSIHRKSKVKQNATLRHSKVINRKYRNESGKSLQFSTRKDVVNKTIFRYLRKFYTKDFKKYFDFTKVNSLQKDTFMKKLV
jgi:hypothetical protein